MLGILDFIPPVSKKMRIYRLYLRIPPPYNLGNGCNPQHILKITSLPAAQQLFPQSTESNHCKNLALQEASICSHNSKCLPCCQGMGNSPVLGFTIPGAALCVGTHTAKRRAFAAASCTWRLLDLLCWLHRHKRRTQISLQL